MKLKVMFKIYKYNKLLGKIECANKQNFKVTIILMVFNLKTYFYIYFLLVLITHSGNLHQGDKKNIIYK